jgi:hypothetical protein
MATHELGGTPPARTRRCCRLASGSPPRASPPRRCERARRRAAPTPRRTRASRRGSPPTPSSPNRPLDAFTPDAIAAYLDELEQTKAPATVKKERAALIRLARYLRTLGVIDATEIPHGRDCRASPNPARTRDARKLVGSAHARAARPTGGARLLADPRPRRHGPAFRGSPLAAPVEHRRPAQRRAAAVADGARQGRQGLPPADPDRRRRSPLALGTRTPLERPAAVPAPRPPTPRRHVPRRWRQALRTGAVGHRQPTMLAAGVPIELAHAHVLRHTYGSLFMRNGGELSKLQVLMGGTPRARRRACMCPPHPSGVWRPPSAPRKPDAASSRRMLTTDGAGARPDGQRER